MIRRWWFAKDSPHKEAGPKPELFDQPIAADKLSSHAIHDRHHHSSITSMQNTLADLSSLVSSKNVAPIAPRTPFSSGPRLRGGGNARDCPRDQADAHPEGFGAAWLLTNDGGCATMTNEVRHAKAQERKRHPSPSLGSCLHLGVAIPRLPKSLG